jgi:hypothetical protein
MRSELKGFKDAQSLFDGGRNDHCETIGASVVNCYRVVGWRAWAGRGACESNRHKLARGPVTGRVDHTYFDSDRGAHGQVS